MDRKAMILISDAGPTRPRWESGPAGLTGEHAGLQRRVVDDVGQHRKRAEARLQRLRQEMSELEATLVWCDRILAVG